MRYLIKSSLISLYSLKLSVKCIYHFSRKRCDSKEKIDIKRREYQYKDSSICGINSFNIINMLVVVEMVRWISFELLIFSLNFFPFMSIFYLTSNTNKVFFPTDIKDENERTSTKYIKKDKAILLQDKHQQSNFL